MQPFVKYIAKRVLVGTIFLFCVMLLNGTLYSGVHKTFMSDVKTLILGESHFGFINQEIVGDDALALPFPADTYFSMYQKLQEVDRYSDVERLFLVYTYADLSPKFDDVLELERFSYNFNKRNYSIASLGQLLQQSKRWVDVAKVYCKYKLTFDYNYINSSFSDTKSTPFYTKYEMDSDTTTLKAIFDFYKNSPRIKNFTKKPNYNRKVRSTVKNFFSVESISVENSKYLHEIVQYCKSNDIKLYLVGTPLEKYYLSKIPEYFKNEYIVLKDSIIEEYPGTVFLDYTEKFQDPAYFQDQEHMGGYAGAIISRLLGEVE